MITKLMNEELDRSFAAAAYAGNGFVVSQPFRGTYVSASGSDAAVVQRVLREILKTLRTFKADPGAFETNKQLLTQDLDNIIFDSPIYLARRGIITLLADPSWFPVEQKAELATVTATELQNFVDQRLFNSISLEGLVFGRMDCNKSSTIVDLIRSSLALDFKPKGTSNKQRIVKLPAGRRYLKDIQTNHTDHALLACYEPSTADYCRISKICSDVTSQFFKFISLNVFIPGEFSSCA